MAMSSELAKELVHRLGDVELLLALVNPSCGFNGNLFLRRNQEEIYLVPTFFCTQVTFTAHQMISSG